MFHPDAKNINIEEISPRPKVGTKKQMTQIREEERESKMSSPMVSANKHENVS